MAKESSPGSKNGIRIVIAGDRGTGKSSLIVTAVSETFPTNVPPVLPPSRFPDDMFPDHHCRHFLKRNTAGEELKRADDVVLTCACDRPETLGRLSTCWLPELRRLESVELANDVVGCLKGIFSMDDKDNDGAIRPADVEDLFSTAPDWYACQILIFTLVQIAYLLSSLLSPDCITSCTPWTEGPYKDAAPTTALGGLTINGFLSEWALMTLLEPVKSVEYLKFIMYSGDAISAIHLTRRRRTDRKKWQSERNVYQCFVFGPKKAGKSALLDAFLGRPFSDGYMGNTEEQYAVNVVETSSGSKRFLVLREIPEDKSQGGTF